MPVNSFDNYPMSWKPVLDRSQRSLYKALAHQMEQDIQAGILRPGTKLPPQRELADFLDVNVSTITKAFRLCALKGLLSATVGSGTYVAYDVMTNARLMVENSAPSWIDFGATVPPPAGHPIITDLLKELVADDALPNLFNYPREQTAQWQKDTAVQLMSYCGCTTDRQRILTASGGQNALSAVLAALFHPRDRIAVDDHTYPGIKTAAAMFGIQLVPIAQDGDGMSPEALAFACKNEEIKAVYLISACQNPTTITMPPMRRLEIAKVIKQFGCLLIEDGTYQLMHRDMAAVSETLQGQSIYIVTLSKVIAPGLRIAWISVPPTYYQSVSDALYSLNVSVVPIMAELASRVIASGQFEQIMTNHRAAAKARNDLVNRWLGQEMCLGRDEDIFRWLLLPSTIDSATFSQLALSEGVQVFPSEKFAVGKTKPVHAVRLSICGPTDVEQLEKGVRILANLLRTHDR